MGANSTAQMAKAATATPGNGVSPGAAGENALAGTACFWPGRAGPGIDELEATRRRRRLAEVEEQLRAARQEVKRLQCQLRQKLQPLHAHLKPFYVHEGIIGRSPELQRILAQARQVATAGSTVLLLGETGTGKELIAAAIHKLSARSSRPMVHVNCAAIPATLLESELFGREKGAYTGAFARQIGSFELAHGSTLFLDEIGELPLEMQAKLLRVLQEMKIQRLGSPTTIKVDVRILAASNRDLAKLAGEGKFRQDLYYRLNVFPIKVPPLRERRGDIPILASAFINEFAKAMGKDVQSISHANLRELEAYPWPGNVRELRNVIERAVILAQEPTVRVELPRVPVASASGNLTLREVERAHIHHVLELTGWRVRGQDGAAERLGLHPSTLRSRMAKLGLHRRPPAAEIW
jgi:formate hydrogenlyase transcriptional activator